MSLLSFLEKSISVGITTFLHDVKDELLSGKLNKQTAIKDALDGLLTGLSDAAASESGSKGATEPSGASGAPSSGEREGSNASPQ